MDRNTLIATIIIVTLSYAVMMGLVAMLRKENSFFVYTLAFLCGSLAFFSRSPSPLTRRYRSFGLTSLSYYRFRCLLPESACISHLNHGRNDIGFIMD